MNTVQDFRTMTDNLFLEEIYKKSSIIYGNSLRAVEEARNPHQGPKTTVPGLLNFIKKIAGRMLQFFKKGNNEGFGELVHDLKNIMCGVVGSADLAEEYWWKEEYNNAFSSITDLRQATATSRNMIVRSAGDIVAAQASEKFIISESDSKLSKLTEVIQTALNLCENRKIGVAQIESVTSAKVKRIEHDLINVLLNIFNNAYDAMRVKKYGSGESPSLRIYTDMSQDRSMLEIGVQDNGVGIDPDVLNRVFQKGFTTKERYGGKGLGLSSTKKVVEERLKGKITIESEKGRGTKVKICTAI